MGLMVHTNNTTTGEIEAEGQKFKIMLYSTLGEVSGPVPAL